MEHDTEYPMSTPEGVEAVKNLVDLSWSLQPRAPIELLDTILKVLPDDQHKEIKDTAVRDAMCLELFLRWRRL